MPKADKKITRKWQSWALFLVFIAMIRYRYTSKHPVLLNYTPILHETVFRMTLIQMWTIGRSKDIFLTRNKHGCCTILLFYFPQKCAMRSSSIESNNPTIHNRQILCKNDSENFFFPFVKWLCQYLECSNWKLRTQRCTLSIWGRKKNKKWRCQKVNKSNNMVVCELER